MNREVIKPSRKAIDKRDKCTSLSNKNKKRLGLCTAALLCLASTGGTVSSVYSLATMEGVPASCDISCCVSRIPTLECLPTPNMTDLCSRCDPSYCDPDHPQRYSGGPCKYNDTQEEGLIVAENCEFGKAPMLRSMLSIGGVSLGLTGLVLFSLWGSHILSS